MVTIVTGAAPAAHAAGGAGLYAPFPEPSKRPRLDTYLARAGVRAPRARVRAGVAPVPAPGRRSTGTTPSDRAGATHHGTSYGVGILGLSAMFLLIGLVSVRNPLRA